MKILQVMAGSDHGGAETAFVDMCLAMHEAGVAIEVATRPNRVRVPMLEDAGIRVHTLCFGGAFDLCTKWKIGRIIHRFEPDIVQTWMGRAAQKTPNWSSLKSKKRYLVVPRLGGYYRIANFKSGDYFNTNTPDLKDYLVKGGIAADRIRQINNFAEAETVVTPVTRAELDTPEDATVLLTLARLHSSKALDVLLRALVGLPDVYAWIAGEGPLREELAQLADDLGVADRVRFLGWRTDRAALLQVCDICVVPSRVEPFGTVFVQSWAQQKPVIVSDAIGPRQFCRDGEDCLMVPREDEAALRAAIIRLKDDKPLQAALVERAYARYQNEFTREKTLEAYLGYFREILARENIT